MEHRTGAGAVLAGRYRLGEPIGSGGMGKVWRAHDELLSRTVAVKELTAGLYVAEADRAVLHARTKKEARAAARIAHPAVVTVHDVFEHDDRPWIVMEYIDGPSLAEAAKAAGRIEPREAARIGLHVLGALRAAHAVGVLHRDVKPGNVLLAKDGRVLLTDFGIAAIEGDSSITRTGELVGSIDYLAPERVTGGAPDPASDLWSLGATLYTAVEARSPFRRTSPISSLQAVVNDEPPALRQAGALGAVITALLRKDPAQRPSAAEAERMLVEAMEGREPKSAHAYVPTRTLTPEERATPVPAALPPAPEPEPEAPAPAAAPAEFRTEPPTTPAPHPAHPSHPAHPVPNAHPSAHPAAGRSTGGRIRRAAVVAVVAALLGGAGAFGILRYTELLDGADGKGGGSGHSAPAEDPVPDGWERVEDPTGFTLIVPNGWTRQMNGDQIDYTPDNGKHFIRIASDTTPDYDNPYMHLLDLEKQVRQRTDYKRQLLNQNTFRDSTRAALWDFTWTEKGTHAGPRRAIEQMYIAPNGTEYAVYMSGPVEGWATLRQQFDTVLSGWEPPAGTG
ncbi:serine/threonine protein kinase [Streptomyces sp. NBC_00536]|uniref:serine/threonine-protein kinase n=1 Tax=Streptomyces sp. NBC_00536 TaxID=2975769 RepID=UPI002E80D0C2|nr:serine/threonine-protein kinase [Streptomyces sp. NBC_00536]WUC80743.1 serine/threonine protein kinase [Streptomyces sp. NBC_00536]